MNNKFLYDILCARTTPDGCRFHTRCPQKIGDVCETVEPLLEPVSSSSDENHCIACNLEEEEMTEEIE